MARPSTYSIVACDLERNEWGIAVQSKFLAVGAVVGWADPAAGAVATQAFAKVSYGPDGLELLRSGLSAEEAVVALTAADEGRDHRQLGIVDREGRAATYTGAACFEWAGGRVGPGYAAQGNILVSEETVEALAVTFESSAGSSLAERLLECLATAQRAGGDRRGQQSAALLVVSPGRGYDGSDALVDLRVDDHADPIPELRRIYGLHELLFGETPREEWLDVDEQLATELRERLSRLGYAQAELGEAFFAWAGNENLEERIDGVERIDPVVLEQLRKAS